MEQTPTLDADAAWAAVLRRDAAFDGRFVTAVLSTGIYCRPSCAARHPKRENVRFCAGGAEAAAEGLRACLRCRPDEVTRHAAAVAATLRMIEAAEAPPCWTRSRRAAAIRPFTFTASSSGPSASPWPLTPAPGEPER